MAHPPALIIHGHFYQPPRDNPWTGRVLCEPSAAPFHDWNQRIHAECYRPNGWARIVDEHGAVSAIENNYRHINFNFGPTLMSWLAQHHGGTYRRILEADRHSARDHGHGNAIAQGYNHAILPLCNERDLRTQIRWGLVEFETRYRRPAESLWLPETACNDDVMEALIDEKLRYVLLAPRQARTVTIDGEELDVSDGSIDPRIPYRYVDRRDPSRSIAVFFYDGAISQAVAFEGLLSSSRALIQRFADASTGAGSLVHVVTDGETYGHHAKFGDRCLAYALSCEAKRQGFWVTNYGAFLDEHPPEHEVTLHLGDDGRGSSWSCAHGVGRWHRDCGCHTGGQPGYDQRWRHPLRAALDLLRDHAAQTFEEECGELVDDPWQLRHRYIELLLGRASEQRRFLSRHAPRVMGDSERRRLLALLESQRSAMTMYTSCGWFFNELSGIETVQIMRYAGHLIDQLRTLGAGEVEERFVEQLAEAKSNITEQGNGADIYRAQVMPSRVTSASLAAQLSLSTLAVAVRADGPIGEHNYRILELRRERRGRTGVATARIVLRHRRTGLENDYAACALHFGEIDLSCLLRPFEDQEDFDARVERVWEEVERGSSLLSLMRVAEECFGPADYGLECILPDEREAFSKALFAGMRERYAAHYELTFQDSQQAIARFREAGLPLPDELEVAAQMALSERFNKAVAALSVEPFEPSAYDRAAEVVELARRYGCELPMAPVARQLGEVMMRTLHKVQAGDADLQYGRSGNAISRALAILDVSKRLGAHIDIDRPQEMLYDALQLGLATSDELLRLMKALRVSTTALRSPQQSAS